MTNFQNRPVPILRKSNTELSREARHQLKTFATPTSLIFHAIHISPYPTFLKGCRLVWIKCHIRSLQDGIPSPNTLSVTPRSRNHYNLIT